MLCLILIVGGLLIMMRQHDRSEGLFYYFRLEDQVPETHLLRLIERHISFAFLRERLKPSYSETGRPSIDPELLLRILLIGYLYGITSERKWWRNCVCIWPGAGSRGWASIRKFRITPPSRKAGMDGFRNRSYSRSCLSRSCDPNHRGTVCTFYKYLSSAFRAANKFVALTPSYKESFDVHGNTALTSMWPSILQPESRYGRQRAMRASAVRHEKSTGAGSSLTQSVPSRPSRYREDRKIPMDQRH
jgi:hypothetical protein